MDSSEIGPRKFHPLIYWTCLSGEKDVHRERMFGVMRLQILRCLRSRKHWWRWDGQRTWTLARQLGSEQLHVQMPFVHCRLKNKNTGMRRHTVINRPHQQSEYRDNEHIYHSRIYLTWQGGNIRYDSNAAMQLH